MSVFIRAARAMRVMRSAIETAFPDITIRTISPFDVNIIGLGKKLFAIHIELSDDDSDDTAVFAVLPFPRPESEWAMPEYKAKFSDMPGLLSYLEIKIKLDSI